MARSSGRSPTGGVHAAVAAPPRERPLGGCALHPHARGEVIPVVAIRDEVLSSAVDSPTGRAVLSHLGDRVTRPCNTTSSNHAPISSAKRPQPWRWANAQTISRTFDTIIHLCRV